MAVLRLSRGDLLSYHILTGPDCMPRLRLEVSSRH